MTRAFVPRLEALDDRTLLSTLTVLNNLDSGAGSLRDAVLQADHGDTIVFDEDLHGQTIALTSDQLEITKSLIIQGPGADLLAVSGNDRHRVLAIEEGLSVTIAGLTITHGRTSGGAWGAGIMNHGSALTVTNSVLSYNQNFGSQGSHASGGAVALFNDASLTVIESTFLGNRAMGSSGGGIADAPRAILRFQGPSGPMPGAFLDTFVTQGSGKLDDAQFLTFTRTDQIQITNLGGATLGLASGDTIWLDDNAAGWGWFVDPTPWDDSEFTTPGDQGEQNRMDLLTAIAHEVGHLLGYEHSDDGTMHETLAINERHTPTPAVGLVEPAVFDMILIEEKEKETTLSIDRLAQDVLSDLDLAPVQ